MPHVPIWGWCNGTTYQYDPVYTATPEYVRTSIVAKGVKWGLNFIDTYPPHIRSGPPINPFGPQAGDPIPKSWDTYTNPDWNEAAYRELTRYLHDRGIIHEMLIWMTNDPNPDCWEYAFREMGNVLRDGLRSSLDGFQEEYYPANDGCVLTEAISRYHPGAFTQVYPHPVRDGYRPEVPPPLYLGNIMN